MSNPTVDVAIVTEMASFDEDQWAGYLAVVQAGAECRAAEGQGGYEGFDVVAVTKELVISWQEDQHVAMSQHEWTVEAAARAIHRWKHPTKDLDKCICRSDARWAVGATRR